VILICGPSSCLYVCVLVNTHVTKLWKRGGLWCWESVGLGVGLGSEGDDYNRFKHILCIVDIIVNTT